MADDSGFGLRYRPTPLQDFQYAKHYAEEPIYTPLGEREWPIYYLELGRKEDPMIILWHGVGSLAGQFFEYSRIMESLAQEGYYVVAPDLPGHGKTPCPDREEDFQLRALVFIMEEFTRRILEKSRSPSCVWVAHSLSSGVAVAWLSGVVATASHPLPKLKGILAMSLPVAQSVPFLMNGATLPGALSVAPSLLYRFGWPYFSLYIRTVTHDRTMRRKLLDLHYPRSPEIVRAKMQFIRANAHLITNPDSLLSELRAASLPMPLAFIHGKEDNMFPPQYARELIARYLGEVPFTVLSDAGHNIPDDVPDVVVRFVLAFTRSCFA